jgi:hypothetical protein
MLTRWFAALPTILIKLRIRSERIEFGWDISASDSSDDVNLLAEAQTQKSKTAEALFITR